MLSLKITAAAKKDLVEILRYTIQEFGENQWKKYGESIDESLQAILKNPSIGHKRNDLPDYCYAWPIGSHFIIYKIDNQTIFVLRVLHQSMNFVFKFK